MRVLDFSAALVLSGAAMVALSPTLAAAQAPAGNTAASDSAKPNPYEGVSQPPASDVITATEAAPPVQPASAPPPAQPAVAPAPAVIPAAAPAATSGKVSNPDYGIVEGVAADTPTATSSAVGTPKLQSRRHYNPDADIVTSVSLPDNELPEGTPLRARIDQEISSRENGAGTPWTAQVSQNVMQNGRVFIPVGSVIHGRVTHADYGRRMYGAASLRLTPDDVVLPDGMRYTLHALVSQTASNSNTKLGREGAIQSKDHPKRVAAEYAAGGGSGAVLGAAVAGPAGAIAGSAVGVGVVTAHWLRTKHAAVLPANSEITFGLTQPLILNTVNTAHE